MQVSDLMTQKVATVPTSATLADAARVMWDNDCGIVPVISEDNTLRGVITDRDICMGGLTQLRSLHEISVLDSMAPSPKVCSAQDDVDAVHRLMREHKVRRVPVVDAQNHLEGIVSISDLAVRAHQAKSGSRKHQETQLARSVETISEQRSDEIIVPPFTAKNEGNESV